MVVQMSCDIETFQGPICHRILQCCTCPCTLRVNGVNEGVSGVTCTPRGTTAVIGCGSIIIILYSVLDVSRHAHYTRCA